MVKTWIEVEKATAGYRTGKELIPVLKDVSFELKAGDFVAAVGLNGSGKSTLIRCITGGLKTLKGSVRIGGQELNSIPGKELAKKIALVLTDKIEGFNLTVFDLVAAGQMPYTNSFHQLEESHLRVINEALDITELREYTNRKLHELSDGLFQKSLIAKALAQQSPVMLLDEPTAFLDYGSKHRLFELLKALTKEQDKCILVTSHDLELAGRYCNKVLIVANGSCKLLNTEDAKKHPDFLAIGGSYL